MANDLDFGVLLALAYGTFVEEMREHLAAVGHDGLHRSFGYVARAVAVSPLTLSELATRLGMTSPGALKIVDDMEASGHVERVADGIDRRAKRIRLTKKGAAALAAARAFHQSYEAALAARIGERRASACRAVLEDVVERGEAAGRTIGLRPM